MIFCLKNIFRVFKVIGLINNGFKFISDIIFYLILNVQTIEHGERYLLKHLINIIKRWWYLKWTGLAKKL